MGDWGHLSRQLNIMNKITQEQLKHSHKLLNEYYLQKYNSQMGRLNKFVSDEIVIEEEGYNGVIDESEEIEFERTESLEKERRRRARENSQRARVNGISNQGMSMGVESPTRYSKKLSNKSNHKEKELKSKDNSLSKSSSSPTKSDAASPIKRDIFDLNKPLNSIREVSETQSLFGPPKSLFSSKSKQVSSIKKLQRDDDTRSMGQKSYYSAAVQSKLTKTSSPLKKSKREKKNFKKALLQKKYQTTNLNQTTHKSEHQSQLHVRQITQPDLINFSMVAHQRKQDIEERREEAVLIKDFKKVGESLVRELNEEANWENVPEVPEGKATLLVMKPVKELLVDNTSIFQNVDIKQCNDSDVAYSDDQCLIPEQSQFHEKIGQIFDQRIERARTTSPLKISQSTPKIQKVKNEANGGKSSRSDRESNSSKDKFNKSDKKKLKQSREDEESQEPSLPPSKYEERDDSSVFSSEGNYNHYTTQPQVPTPSKFSPASPRDGTTHKKYIPEMQQKRRQEQQLMFRRIKSQQALRDRKRKLSYEKQELFLIIQQKTRTTFSKSIDQISKLLTNSSIQFSVQEMLVATLRKLISDSEELQHRREMKHREMQESRARVSHLLDQRGQRKMSQYHQQIQTLINNPNQLDEAVISDDQDESQMILVNKTIISKLAHKCYLAIDTKVQRQRESE